MEGLIVAAGFSGHGFKIAPAVGSLVAQEITGKKMDFDTNVDAQFFAYDRVPHKLNSLSVLA
jgi:sarcosine oxidase subunit beta